MLPIPMLPISNLSAIASAHWSLGIGTGNIGNTGNISPKE